MPQKLMGLALVGAALLVVGGVYFAKREAEPWSSPVFWAWIMVPTAIGSAAFLRSKNVAIVRAVPSVIELPLIQLAGVWAARRYLPTTPAPDPS